MPPVFESAAMGDRPAHFDVVVVGAGFAGLYMLYRLRTMGLRVRVFEAGPAIGGTWFWNRYPGARCDVHSVEYSYQFSEALQQEWEWSERFATQPEILRYLNHVADRFALRDDIALNTRVLAAHFDEAANCWDITTEHGRAVATYCVFASGCLSVPFVPEIAGRDSFDGAIYHTGAWPSQPVDFRGKRVAVIGTGSSGTQAIPLIAEDAAQLYVCQRTPSYTVPARNQPLNPKDVRELKAHYAEFRARNWTMFGGLNNQRRDESALTVSAAEREAEFERRWQIGGTQLQASFNDLLIDAEANSYVADFVRRKIRATVTDPVIAEKLCPRDALGCRRVVVGSNFYETFNRANVTLIDALEAPISAFSENGIVVDGKEIPVDIVVMATGFDAITGALLKVDIRGRNDLPLAHKWKQSPSSYLGLAVSGFPNLFTITGPCSPNVFSNMVASIEQHVNWIADCIGYLQNQGIACIEANAGDEASWVEHVGEIAAQTLLLSCNSWYLGANIPGKNRVFSVYVDFPGYIQKCVAEADAGYPSFALN